MSISGHLIPTGLAALAGFFGGLLANVTAAKVVNRIGVNAKEIRASRIVVESVDARRIELKSAASGESALTTTITGEGIVLSKGHVQSRLSGDAMRMSNSAGAWIAIHVPPIATKEAYIWLGTNINDSGETKEPTIKLEAVSGAQRRYAEVSLEDERSTIRFDLRRGGSVSLYDKQKGDFRLFLP